jgi:hypothetical protein
MMFSGYTLAFYNNKKKTPCLKSASRGEPSPLCGSVEFTMLILSIGVLLRKTPPNPSGLL